jgi:hypothetical protein
VSWALLIGLALLLCIALFDDFAVRRRAAKKCCGVNFHPGTLLAGQLLATIFIWFVDGAGNSRKTRMVVQNIYGPERDHPTYVAGFCYHDHELHVLRVEQILAIEDLESGEVYADPSRALAALAWRAQRATRVKEAKAARNRKAG